MTQLNLFHPPIRTATWLLFFEPKCQGNEKGRLCGWSKDLDKIRLATNLDKRFHFRIANAWEDPE